MSNTVLTEELNKILDEALLLFDEDDADVSVEGLLPAPTSGPGPGSAPPAQGQQSSPEPVLPAELDPLARSSGETSTSQPASSAGRSAAGSRGRGIRAAGGRPPFDPLASHRQRGSRQKQEAQHLQGDLQRLINDWTQAMEADHAAAAPASTASSRSAAGPEPPSRGSASSVLQDLAAQTQRTVEQQARLNPTPPPPPSAGPPGFGGLPFGALPGLGGMPGPGAASGGGQEGDHMSIIVQTVMQHLLSKEVLYAPMMEIKAKYPPWLDANMGRVDEVEYKRYEKQYGCILRLCRAYEEEPENFTKLMGLLQEMQECGEPPAEIVEDMTSAIAAEHPGLAAAGIGGASGSGAGGSGGVMGGLRGLMGSLRGFMGGARTAAPGTGGTAQDPSGQAGQGPTGAGASGLGSSPFDFLSDELLDELAQSEGFRDDEPLPDLPKDLRNCGMQ